ncbi:MAG: DUF2291 domain-containing protein [Ferruginibacter sp.]
MKKTLKYITLVAVIGLLGYNSVWFKKLDTKKETISTDTSPVEFAKKFWANIFTPYLDSAADFNQFYSLLNTEPQKAMDQYAHRQGISNTSFVLLKGEGIVDEIKGNETELIVKNGAGNISVKLNTGLYFGNAIRDVTGKINMGDFNNTMDYNAVSTELNKIVQQQVVVPFKNKISKGQLIQFIGCTELNSDQTKKNVVEILPVRIIYK